MKNNLGVTYVVVTCFNYYSWWIKESDVVYIKLYSITVTSELT